MEEKWGNQKGQDRPHQTTTRTMATGKAAKEKVLATKHEGGVSKGTSLSQIRDIQVIFFFSFLIYFISRGVKSKLHYSNHVISRPDCIVISLLTQRI